MGNAIPYSNLYDNWLNLDCEDAIFESLPIEIRPKKHEYVVKNMYTVKTITAKFLADPESPSVFYPVIYYAEDDEERFVHYAACLRRNGNMEYIDSMAIPDNPSQMDMETKLKEAALAAGLKYKGADVMYGGIVPSHKYRVNYLRFPPQSAEHVFLGTLSMVTPELLKYAKSLEKYEGGDCIMWAHLIARSMCKHSLTSEEWSKKFTETAITKHVKDVELAVGLFASLYITRHLIKDLQRCSRQKLRKL
jgi:uncharacterized glyoxalase superfamily protein PhnB